MSIKHSSETNEWYTPPAIIEDALSVIGEERFTIDVAASLDSIEKVNGKYMRNFYTKEDNGLIQNWVGDIWCNPPYGGKAGPFLEKGVVEIEKPSLRNAVYLIAPHVEAKWYRPVYDQVRVVYKKRIKFISYKTLRPKKRPGHGNVMVFVKPRDAWEEKLALYIKARDYFGDRAEVIPPKGLLEWMMEKNLKLERQITSCSHLSL